MSIYSKKSVKFVSKTWGFEKWFDNNEKYCGKLLFFVKGLACSLHYHKLKTETFYLHKGKLEIRFYDNAPELEEYIEKFGTRGLDDKLEKEILEQGDTFFVPAGRVHSMRAIEDSELFEISTQHFEEDSYRLIDSKELNE
jgi:quercetin dioxygenase-like cupin family protein